jgi:hypothetical protein
MNSCIPKRSDTVTAALSATLLLCVTYLFTFKLFPICHILQFQKQQLKEQLTLSNCTWLSVWGLQSPTALLVAADWD